MVRYSVSRYWQQSHFHKYFTLSLYNTRYFPFVVVVVVVVVVVLFFFLLVKIYL